MRRTGRSLRATPASTCPQRASRRSCSASPNSPNARTRTASTAVRPLSPGSRKTPTSRPSATGTLRISHPASASGRSLASLEPVESRRRSSGSSIDHLARGATTTRRSDRRPLLERLARARDANATSTREPDDAGAPMARPRPAGSDRTRTTPARHPQAIDAGLATVAGRPPARGVRSGRSENDRLKLVAVHARGFSLSGATLRLRLRDAAGLAARVARGAGDERSPTRVASAEDRTGEPPCRPSGRQASHRRLRVRHRGGARRVRPPRTAGSREAAGRASAPRSASPRCRPSGPSSRRRRFGREPWRMRPGRSRPRS